MRASDGMTDCCITSEFDAQALRRMQLSHRSPYTPLKPALDGF